jgi:hypothetical protein
MQITIHPTPGLTAAEAAQREQQVRRWLLRIYQLMQISGCELATAIRAIEAADRESARNN